MLYLGIDTSNYTTSAALFDTETRRVIQKKKLLPVKSGEKGIRQSDAVFHHTVQLPKLLTALFEEEARAICGVGVSIFPRREEGSYMPCFLAGESAATAIATAMHIPCVALSHQEGHITAALFSAKRLSLIQAPFLAFHVSGGTTEALLVTPHDTRFFQTECVARSLDLKAGQAIDRVGVMLGLDFPCGAALEKLSLRSTRVYTIKPTMKDENCCLSGVENQCAKMLQAGEAAEDIARFCMDSVRAALNGMVLALRARYGALPLLFSGGVASNCGLRAFFSEAYNAYFAEPAYSADNAAGVAILAAMQDKGYMPYDV